MGKAWLKLMITNLVIPTLNDSDETIRNLCRWIVQNMGADTPLHFSRFFPQYKMKNLPPTPAETLSRAAHIAASEGLHYVYVGNILIPDAQKTRCPECGETLIDRRRYAIVELNLREGRCPACKHDIAGVWQ